MVEHVPEDGDLERRAVRASRFVRVLVADDRTVLPDCRARLEGDEQLVVVGETGWPADLVPLTRQVVPRVVVVVAPAGAGDAIDVVRELRESVPSSDVVLVSTRTDDDYVRRCLEAGARAYVLRDDPDLGRAVRAVAAGGAYFSPEVATVLREGYLHGGGVPIDGLLARLSDSECAVLQALLEGHTTGEIAARLELPVATVDECRDRIVGALARRETAPAVDRPVRAT